MTKQDLHISFEKIHKDTHDDYTNIRDYVEFLEDKIEKIANDIINLKIES